ncbi:TniB family NTP-binding protein [Achromobacter aegrifaciens]|uniref:TniB family NTP-binding protein n=1 Tax=Achromobacter aegrifaciens TaxID=1287736 RepID=UPI0027B9BE2F|nr:TniB family NTP-binding protein [Achromobacter aegrifaciens]WLW62802.1 TniB family NTP-binding protein [Achromobacter aegrifaciens]
MSDRDSIVSFSASALAAGRALGNVIVPHPDFERCAAYVLNAIQLAGTSVFSGARVSAASGGGKTLLIRYIERLVEARFGAVGCTPIITGSLKERPTIGQIQSDLLQAMNYTVASGGNRSIRTNNEVNRVLVRTISDYNVKLLAIDEFQHVFHVDGRKSHTDVIDWLKRLMNLTGVAVLLVGTEQMDMLGGVDPQLTTRIPTVLRLSPFKYDQRWRGFLQAFVSDCVEVDLSPIVGEFARPLFLASGGSPRVLKALLVQAVILAVHEEAEVISREILGRSYDFRFGADATGRNPFAVS